MTLQRLMLFMKSPTIFPDDAVSGGRRPRAICHGHGVHAAVLSAVATDLQRRLLPRRARVDAGPRTGAAASAAAARARARGQRHSRGGDSRFGLPLPGHRGDLLLRPQLHAGFQEQTGTGDHVHGLLRQDAHRQTQEPTRHCGRGEARLLARRFTFAGFDLLSPGGLWDYLGSTGS